MLYHLTTSGGVLLLLRLKKPLPIFNIKCRTVYIYSVFYLIYKESNVLLTRIPGNDLWLYFTLEIDAYCIFTVVSWLLTTFQSQAGVNKKF